VFIVPLCFYLGWFWHYEETYWIVCRQNESILVQLNWLNQFVQFNLLNSTWWNQAEKSPRISTNRCVVSVDVLHFQFAC